MTIKLRMRLYNIYILPLICYNLGSVAYNQAQLDKLDSHHREQLRQVLRIFYPTKIHNKQLYNMTNSSPITIIAMEQRWKLFGHILRSHPNTPARIIMSQYYTETSYQRRGRPHLTLPAVLNNDLKLIHTNLVDKLWFNTLINSAQDRKKWQEFTGQLVTRLKEELDRKRHVSEIKRNIPTSAQLT